MSEFWTHTDNLQPIALFRQPLAATQNVGGMRHLNGTVEFLAEVVDARLIVRYTRQWLHYGTIAFVVLCTLVGAVRGLAESW